MNPRRILVMASALGIAACAPVERRFPLREPLLRDTDLRSVSVACHASPTPKEPKHVSCAPDLYVSSFYWDGLNSLLFRPLTEHLRVLKSDEAVNVNSLDEVPDSAWFTNRLGKRAMTEEELRLGACRPEELLDPDHDPDGSWVIHKGKSAGQTPGFRIKVAGKGEFMIKAENAYDQPEREGAASMIGSAVLHAAGYYVPCEQIVYVRPSLFKLTPGLKAKSNWGDESDFDQKALEAIFKKSTKRGDLLRFGVSTWLSGHALGPARFEGTRGDDPNDVIPHEDRREIRAMRVLAAWLNRFDAREANSLDIWLTDKKGAPPDSSPGHVIHYQLDTSETLGSWLDLGDEIATRLGHGYMLDFGQIGADFISLGAISRPWDTVQLTPKREIFGFFDVEHFSPEHWKPEYSNAAFIRMTERDGAWMARILSGLSPELVRALAKMGKFTDPGNTEYLTGLLEGRLKRIMERYLTRLSPIGDVRVEKDELCGVDFAERRSVRPAAQFHYSARTWEGSPLPVRRRPGAEVCATLSHSAPDGGAPDDDPSRYARVRVEDGVAKGKLVVHLYDLGPARGFRLAGIERPNP